MKEYTLLFWNTNIYLFARTALILLGSSLPHGSQDIAELLPLSLGADVSANLGRKHKRYITMGKPNTRDAGKLPYSG